MSAFLQSSIQSLGWQRGMPAGSGSRSRFEVSNRPARRRRFQTAAARLARSSVPPPSCRPPSPSCLRLSAAGDWLQGPHVYRLYDFYGFDMGAIGKLFIAGAPSLFLDPSECHALRCLVAADTGVWGSRAAPTHQAIPSQLSSDLQVSAPRWSSAPWSAPWPTSSECTVAALCCAGHRLHTLLL